MKKLLSFLGVIAIGVAPVATVIACGETNDNKEDDNQDVLKGKDLQLDANKILDIITKYGDDALITGNNPEITLQKFLNIFAYALVSKTDTLPALAANNLYENDNFIANIKQDFETFNRDTTDSWNRKVKDAREKYKNDFDKNFKEDLEKEFEKEHQNWEDYKEDFIFRAAISNDNNSAPMKSLSNQIFGNFATSAQSNATSDVINNLKTLFFDVKNTFGKDKDGKDNTVDFISNAKTLNTVDLNSAVPRKNSWFGQFDIFLNGLKTLYDEWQTAKTNNASDAKDKEDIFKSGAFYLVNLLNATGGLELEKFLAQSPTPTVMTIEDVKWASYDNIVDAILNSNDIPSWSNKLVKRWDSNYTEHYNDTVASGTAFDGVTLNLTANAFVDSLGVSYGQIFNVFPDLLTQESIRQDSQISGLFSNSQRYFANQYFQQKKPVAITEFVVKPWETGDNIISLENEVTNSPFIGTSKFNYIGFYNFINTFVNSSISGQSDEKTDFTKKMFNNQTNYSWDVLLEKNGNLKDISHNGGNWTPEKNEWNGFDENLSPVEHAKLLTVDSIENDTLKYAIYDFLTHQQEKTEFKDWQTDPRKVGTGNITDFDYTDSTKISVENQAYALPISSLIHSLARNNNDNSNLTQKDSKNVYQVLNDEQGIIAYTDKDGIHFVRIEGYQLIKTPASGNPNNVPALLKEQQRLSINNPDLVKNYANFFQLNWNNSDSNNTDINKPIPEAARAVTYDYLNRNTLAQTNSKNKYQYFNSMFGNSYLEFLANSSIINNVLGSSTDAKYKYNFASEVKSWLDNTSVSPANNWIAVWDYLKEIYNIKNDANGKTGDEKLFDDFFSMDTSKITNNEIKKTVETLMKNYRSAVLTALSRSRGEISTNWSSQLARQWQKYMDDHENMVKSTNPNIKYNPWNYLKPGDKFETIFSLENSDIWKPDSASSGAAQFAYKIDINKYIITNKKVVLEQGGIN